MTEALEARRLFAVTVPDAFGYTATSSDAINGELLREEDPGVSKVDFDSLDDDAQSLAFPAESSFTFYNESYSELFVGTNGVITFDFKHLFGFNVDLGPTNFPAPGIAPLWDDWIVDGDGVLYRFDTDQLTVQWSTVHFDGGDSPVQFQAVLDLNTGATNGGIVFNYFNLDTGNPDTSNGLEATVGIKQSSFVPAFSRLLVSYNTANDFVEMGKSIRITHGAAPAPIATADVATVEENGSVDIDVLANDALVGAAPFVVDVIDAPEHGFVAPNPPNELNPNETFKYTPDPDFSGTDFFTYSVTNADGESSAPVSVTITVTPANDPPVAGDDSYATVQDGASVAGNVLDNDTDPNDDPLAVALIDAPGHGTFTLLATGEFTYAPQVGFSGTDRFTYELIDGRGGTDEATVTITVSPAAEGSVYTVDDPTAPGQKILIVNGSSGNDVVSVSEGENGVALSIAGRTGTPYSGVGKVFVYGRDGNDVVGASGLSAHSVWVYGDAGNDVISLGDAGGIAFGGAGSDLLLGGDGRDILLGGGGSDLLYGHHGEDILISALTAYDDRFASAEHIEAWAAIRAEWLAPRDFAVRVSNLRSGGLGERLNGSFFLNSTTLTDDGARDQIDILAGGSGKDWYIYGSTGDVVTLLTEVEARYDQVLT